MYIFYTTTHCIVSTHPYGTLKYFCRFPDTESVKIVLSSRTACNNHGSNLQKSALTLLTFMDRKEISNYAKAAIIATGGGVFALALAYLPAESFSWGFVCILMFAVLLAPRMTLALPRSRFAISFSDASVFLTFLVFGGPAAIIVASLESLASCWYLRSKGFPFGRLMIPTNASINAVSIGVTYLIWLNVPRASFISPDHGSTQHEQ